MQPFLLKILIVLGSAFIPLWELKGAIPLGIASGLPLWLSFILAYVGSTLPVFVVINVAVPVIKWLKTKKMFAWYGRWMEKRASGNYKKWEKNLIWGLFIFVAIPLPTTGVWSGSIIAAVLGLEKKPAIIAIVVGNLLAGLIVLLVSYILV